MHQGTLLVVVLRYLVAQGLQEYTEMGPNFHQRFALLWLELMSLSPQFHPWAMSGLSLMVGIWAQPFPEDTWSL